jgi:hypothetical protein
MDIGINTINYTYNLKKIAHTIKMKYNALSARGPLGLNIRIDCPVPLGKDNYSINALIYEFRESFAFDAVIVYNRDYNIFCFDFT